MHHALMQHTFAAILVVAMTACSSAPPPPPSGPAVVELAVMSGRPQEKKEANAATGDVVLRIEGLGPPKALVIAPDGNHLSTIDAPLRRGGSVVGTESRFTASTSGTYRVEDQNAPGQLLALVHVH